jgi:transcriptional regulator with XRE-family HTH domain
VSKQRDLAQALTALRKERGFTQKQVADSMGCHVSYVQAFEYQLETNRKIQTYLDYATAVGATIDFNVIAL